MTSTKQIPDITIEKNSMTAHKLKWVGMEKIGLPIKLKLSDGLVVAINAEVDIFVSLDANVKGIHMSRLYLKLNEKLANQVITTDGIERLMDSLLASHVGISDSAKIKLSFEIPLNKKALISHHSGYQVYPVAITHQYNGKKADNWIEMTIPYSSTCPCSAALATQLIGESIANQFPDESLNKAELLQWLSSKDSMLATPHNQRSYAYVKMQTSQKQLENLDKLIFQFEDALGTPVQTAVKREDEQEFARLNGDNLMFCEDAARRLKGCLESIDFVKDYWFKVEHQESLHAHNAVVIDQKTESRLHN